MLPPACANAAHVAPFDAQAKIDAKIAEAQASLAAKEVAKKEEQKSRLGEADRAMALEAEKAQRGEAEKARKAQEFIDTEKAPDALEPEGAIRAKCIASHFFHCTSSELARQAKQKTGAAAPVADPAAAAQVEKLAQLKAEEAEMQKKQVEGERKQKEREEADERSRQLRGGV